MKYILEGKESYLEQAIKDQFSDVITDVTFSIYDETDQLPILQATNLLTETPTPCTLKTNGKTLWLLFEDNNWVVVGSFELNSYIPQNEEPVFVNHLEAIDLIKSYNFSEEDMIDLLGVLYSQRVLTKVQITEELNSAKELFDLSNKKTQSID